MHFGHRVAKFSWKCQLVTTRLLEKHSSTTHNYLSIVTMLLIRACVEMGARIVFTWLKPYLNARVLISETVCKGLSQPIANQLNMQKTMVLIFLTIKVTIFDTHGRTDNQKLILTFTLHTWYCTRKNLRKFTDKKAAHWKLHISSSLFFIYHLQRIN